MRSPTKATRHVTEYFFFFTIILMGTGSVIWDLPATPAAGDNTVVFTQANSERVR
jgi:hypothetical protein